jgi:hypothetical protein
MALLGWLLGITTALMIIYVALHPTSFNLPLGALGLLLIGLGTVRDESWWDQLRSYGLLLVWAVFTWTWLVVEGLWPNEPLW